MNAPSLLTKATNGTLDEPELMWVKDQIDSGSNDTYTLLLILGRSFAKKYRQTVERFLESPRDPMLARAAVYALCQCWGETDRYLAQIKAFCRKVSWDVDDDVRLIAITCAGDHLRSQFDKELAQSLLTIARNDPNVVVRGAAQSAIARAIGASPAAIPSPRKLAEGKASIDPSIIAAFERKITSRR